MFDYLASVALALSTPETAGATAPIIAGASLTITGTFGVTSALFKTAYLRKVRPYEYDSFWGQLLGTGFGGAFEDSFSRLKNCFKGNENPSSSNNVVEPTSGT